MRKTNWKILIFLWVPFYLIMVWLFGLGGALGAGVNALLAYVPMYLLTRIFKLDMNEYYDHEGKKITKNEYEKLERKVDYGFNWLPKRLKKQK